MNYRELILSKLSEKKLSSNELRAYARVKGARGKAAFFSALRKLEEDHLIFKGIDGLYSREREIDGEIKGIIQISRAGTGTVTIQTEYGEKNYLIQKENLNGALDGDTVIIKRIRKVSGAFIEASVEKVVERATGEAIFEYDGTAFVPYNAYGNIKVVCPKKTLRGIVAGHLALIRLDNNFVAQFEDATIFEGDIIQMVGHIDDPDIEVKAIGANHGFFTDFPKDVMEELKHIPDHVCEEELEGRVDLRDETIFTIDGSHTKDMDDAVSIDVDKDGNYILRVHIADVNHYVPEGSALDVEARRRGTSAYLSDSVLPMLPHQLSNGICSLNEGEDRLTKTVEIIIDKEGNIISHKIYDSVINSKKKMTYEEVNQILEYGIIPEGYEPFEEDLLVMYSLSDLLTKKRIERGNIDFASDEIEIEINDGAMQFVGRGEGLAEKLIENLMILANETVAKHYSDMKLPIPYRVHGNPHDDSLIQRLSRLKEEGICGNEVGALINKIRRGKCTSKDVSIFLRSYEDTEIYEIVSAAILTSMSKARYSEENEGHYGLSLDYYTHFTSPIRRYPDLIVHRLIDQYLDSVKAYDIVPEVESKLPEICKHSSYMEREADAAERETLDLKMAEYASDRIGKGYRGKVTSFTSDGMTVKLDNNIRGIVIKDTKPSKKKARSKTRQYKIGESVFAIIKDVSIPHRVIYFDVKYSLDDKPKTKKMELR